MTRRLAAPLLALAAAVLLAGLGVWQVERLFWKRALIASVDGSNDASYMVVALINQFS